MSNVAEKKNAKANEGKQRGRKKGQDTVDIGEFVYFWEKANTKEEVATHFNMTLQSVTTKANNIRKDYFDGLRTFERKDSGLKDKVLAALAKARNVSVDELLASAKDIENKDTQSA